MCRRSRDDGPSPRVECSCKGVESQDNLLEHISGFVSSAVGAIDLAATTAAADREDIHATLASVDTDT